MIRTKTTVNLLPEGTTRAFRDIAIGELLVVYTTSVGRYNVGVKLDDHSIRFFNDDDGCCICSIVSPTRMYFVPKRAHITVDLV